MSKYSVKAIINGEHYSKRTDDVEATLLKLKPEFILTEMYVTVKKDKQTFERRLLAKDARKFFNDEIYRMVFMSNLVFA
jgi:hypothetical protein